MDRTQIIYATVSGIIGGFLGPVCCCINWLSGGIAVSLYVRSKPDVFINDKEACLLGGLSGLVGGTLSILLYFVFFSQIYATFTSFFGGDSITSLQQTISKYNASV